ncbi:hypothetical protein BgAZ_305430 [Babesia gibsoni]|uniref:Amino acid transporter n=1 Tax=Babesia gibsoni TaxID=33632 RepID=A0AAD8P903_BABGI|nr:hypothetical protein BgAZ_305430 [Babesia gibsoni]
MFGWLPFAKGVTTSDFSGPFVRSRKRFKAYTWKYKKTITPIASFVLLVNQLMGFGISDIPSTIREAGWLPSLLANVFVCILATLCSLMLLRAMTLIPHNDNFDHRIEYNTLVKYYLSDHNFKFVAFLNHLGDLCTVVCGILVFAKLIDMLLVQALGWTLALQVYPFVRLGRVDIRTVSAIYESHLMPATEQRSVTLAITVGYLICAVICMRLSYCALEETMGFHHLSFVALIGCIAQLTTMGLSRYVGGAKTEKPPTIGKARFATVLMTFVDNYTLASSTPSWANEMTNDVKVMQTIWTSTFFSCITYHLLGYVLCVAFPDDSGSIFTGILFSKTGPLTNAVICLFIVVTILPDIVFGSISTKYNLLNLGYCEGSAAYFWGCVFPFTFTWLLSNESVFMDPLSHIGLTCSLFCDFFIPIVVYKAAKESFSDFSKESHLVDQDSYGRGQSTDEDQHTGMGHKLLKKGTSILFGKIGSLSRLVTRDYLHKQFLDEGEENDMDDDGDTDEDVNDDHVGDFEQKGAVAPEKVVPEVDYLSFKIIKPPARPRPDDNQYSVISKRRKCHLVIFANNETPEESDQDKRDARGAMGKPKENRVKVFPIVVPDEYQGLISRAMIVLLGTMAVLPTAHRIFALW